MPRSMPRCLGRHLGGSLGAIGKRLRTGRAKRVWAKRRTILDWGTFSGPGSLHPRLVLRGHSMRRYPHAPPRVLRVDRGALTVTRTVQGLPTTPSPLQATSSQQRSVWGRWMEGALQGQGRGREPSLAPGSDGGYTPSRTSSNLLYLIQPSSDPEFTELTK